MESRPGISRANLTAWEDNGMVGDIAFSQELIELDIIATTSATHRYRLQRGRITKASIKPGINHLVFVSRKRDRSASFDVSCDTVNFKPSFNQVVVISLPLLDHAPEDADCWNQAPNFGLKLVQFENAMLGFFCDLV